MLVGRKRKKVEDPARGDDKDSSETMDRFVDDANKDQIIGGLGKKSGLEENLKKIKTVDQVCRDLFSDCLLKFQTDLINDKSRVRIVEKSRRVGITWTVALEAVLKRVFGPKPIDMTVSSADYRMALEFIKDCRRFAEAINDASGYEVVPVDAWTQDIAKFRNESRICAISSDPKAFRGRKGDVLLDEFAFHEDQGELLKAAQPLIIRDPESQLTIVSTHNGPGTFFEQLCRDAQSGKLPYSWRRVTLLDACQDGLAMLIDGPHKDAFDGTKESLQVVTDRFMEFVRSTCASEEDFQQEYMCRPAASSGIISPGDYDELVLPYDIPRTLRHEDRYGELFVGIDCGLVKDYTVCWVLERGYDPKAPQYASDVYRTVCVEWLHNTPDREQLSILWPILTHPDISSGLVDMGSVGRSIADAVHEETGGVIKPYAVTAPRKASMAALVRSFVSQRRVSLHPDSVVRRDILSVRRYADPMTGRVRIEGGTEYSHGDFFWALGMALESASVNVAQAKLVVEDDGLSEGLSGSLSGRLSGSLLEKPWVG
jgi:phage FluMu gp28-like protein